MDLNGNLVCVNNHQIYIHWYQHYRFTPNCDERRFLLFKKLNNFASLVKQNRNRMKVQNMHCTFLYIVLKISEQILKILCFKQNHKSLLRTEWLSRPLPCHIKNLRLPLGHRSPSSRWIAHNREGFVLDIMGHVSATLFFFFFFTHSRRWNQWDTNTKIFFIYVCIQVSWCNK